MSALTVAVSIGACARDGDLSAPAPQLFGRLEKHADEWVALQPIHNVQAVFRARAVEIGPAGSSVGLELRAGALGRESDQRALGAVEPVVNGRRIEYVRDGLTEWYAVASRGIEHGFLIDERPEGVGHVIVRVEVIGALSVVGVNDRDAVFVPAAGPNVEVRYTGLVAEDALGRDLPARLVALDHAVELRVDDTHARYPIVIDPFVSTSASVVGSDTNSPDLFGSSAAYGGSLWAAFGGLLAGTDGAVYVFRLSTPTSWMQRARIAPTGTDSFGSCLAYESSRLFVGANADDAVAANAGAVFLYNGSDNSWPTEANATLTASDGATTDAFGHSCRTDSTTLIVGAPAGGASNEGAAYVFVQSGGTWPEQARLTPSDGGAGDWFGEAVAIDEDTAVVGAYRHASDTGAAYVFERVGTTWSQVARLSASDGGVGDRFGSAVDIDGDWIVVGAPQADPSGAVYVFRRASGTWTFSAKVVGSVGGSGFGESAELEGPLLVTGTSFVRVFGRKGTTWTEYGLFASGASVIDDFHRGFIVGGNPTQNSSAGRGYIHSVVLPLGAPCTSSIDCDEGICVDGVCCDTACGGGVSADCMACSEELGGAVDGTCGALRSDAASSFVCRTAADACDLPETCLSTATTCPSDTRQAAGTTCRDAVDDCDSAETCPGGASLCPADAREPTGTVCREPAGVCDLAEECDGTSVACPADAFATTDEVCRSQDGSCDLEEHCEGTQADCPVDVFASSGTVCRIAAGVCDEQELCTGDDGACPADALVETGVVCRESEGLCDPAEECTGDETACPADALSPAGTECRAVEGDCDLTETCSGSSVDCPADTLLPAGAICRAATSGCDLIETCDGSAAACGADLRRPSCCENGTDCEDDDPCTLDRCDSAGTGCEHEAIADCCLAPGASCDDDDACTSDACDAESAQCTHAAISGCGSSGDAGRDAEMPDGGGRKRSGGCAMTAASRSARTVALFALLMPLFARMARRRHARPRSGRHSAAGHPAAPQEPRPRRSRHESNV